VDRTALKLDKSGDARQSLVMAKLWIRLVLALPATVALPSAAFAQEPELVTDRPDFTESASVPGGGRVQLESGWTVEGAGDARSHTLGEILVRIGIGDRLEARIATGSVAWNDDGEGEEVSGIDDAGLGVKVLLLDPAPPIVPATALLVSSSVPTGEKEVGASGWQPEARLSVAWDLTDLWSLGANGGWARPLEGEERFDQALGSVALGRSLGARLGAFVELYGLNPSGPDGGDESYLDGGFTFALGPEAQVDLRGGAGLTDDSADWLFGLGFARRW
jgi:hypothetical protein